MDIEDNSEMDYGKPIWDDIMMLAESLLIIKVVSTVKVPLDPLVFTCVITVQKFSGVFERLS